MSSLPRPKRRIAAASHRALVHTSSLRPWRPLPLLEGSAARSANAFITSSTRFQRLRLLPTVFAPTLEYAPLGNLNLRPPPQLQIAVAASRLCAILRSGRRWHPQQIRIASAARGLSAILRSGRRWHQRAHQIACVKAYEHLATRQWSSRLLRQRRHRIEHVPRSRCVTHRNMYLHTQLRRLTASVHH